MMMATITTAKNVVMQITDDHWLTTKRNVQSQDARAVIMHCRYVEVII